MDRDLFRKLASTATNVEQVRSSVMQPLLWMIGLTVPSLLGAAYLMPDFRGILIAAVFVAMVAFIVIYICFAIKDADRLQSEQYQLKRIEMLQMMQDTKGGKVVEDTTLISNPEPSDKQGAQS